MSCNARIMERNAEIRNRDDKIRIQADTIGELERTCAHQLTWIRRQKVEIDHLTDSVQTKDAEIKRLSNEVQEGHEWHSKLDGDIANLTDLIAKRDETCQKFRAEVAHNKKIIDELRRANAELTEMVDARDEEIKRLLQVCKVWQGKHDDVVNEWRICQAHLDDATKKIQNLQAAVNHQNMIFAQKCELCERLQNETKDQKARIAQLVLEVQALTADKVGLETTLQSKNATIDDLGINLNNTQLEQQRLAMVANHNMVVAENTGPWPPPGGVVFNTPLPTVGVPTVDVGPRVPPGGGVPTILGGRIASPVRRVYPPYTHPYLGVQVGNYGPGFAPGLTTDVLGQALSPKK